MVNSLLKYLVQKSDVSHYFHNALVNYEDSEGMIRSFLMITATTTSNLLKMGLSNREKIPYFPDFQDTRENYEYGEKMIRKLLFLNWQVDGESIALTQLTLH
ncbi:MAG: hypothetical protein JO235_20585 [Chroococcidiopsidaceae cyanobacterium CP_BM_RX_35]|nr:hypothetical protein [Chroococcidiopsidaceae cyanobacterium CP_BM_RX_35]